MGDSGRKREVSDRELLVAARNIPEPVFTAKEVAQEVDMTQQGVDKRLRKLEDDQLVNSAKKGASRVWWVTYRGRKFVD